MYTRLIRNVFCSTVFLLAGLCAVLSASSVYAGELSVSPPMPRIGERASFSYKPDSAWRNSENIYVLVYRFREISGEPVADYVKLTRRFDGNYSGEINVLQTDVFWMMKMFNGSRYDDNSGHYWDTRITSDGTKPLQGSLLRNAITFLGSLPTECSRSSDFPKALQLLREELRLYPNNLSAKVAEVALAYDVKDISEETYRRSLQNYVSQPFDTTRENDTRAVIRGLNALGMANQGKALEDIYIKRFPKSKIAEDNAMQVLQVQVVPDWFLARAVDFVVRFRESPTSPMMQGAAVATFAQVRRLKDAAKWLDTLPNVSPLAYNELAKYWCRTDTTEERGLRYAQKALELAKRQPLYQRPGHIAEIEWNMNTTATLGDVYNTLSAIYVELKRNDEALATFTNALEITKGELPSPAFSQAAGILFEKKRYAEALAIAAQGIITTGGDNVLMNWHRIAMDSARGKKTDSTLYVAEVQRLKDSSTALLSYKQFKQRLDRELIDGTVFTTDHTPVVLSSLKGKPTMIMFWSSWAEPCLKAMPFVNVLYNKYAKAGDFNIVVIDAWEDKGKDQFGLVRDYMARNSSLYFSILVDENNIMAQKYGVTGLPMRFYLDKNGRIQYKGSGFTDGLKLTQEIEETMLLLGSERFYLYQ
jgi:thiol-disulfide isomerase/thioredoxin